VGRPLPLLPLVDSRSPAAEENQPKHREHRGVREGVLLCGLRVLWGEKGGVVPTRARPSRSTGARSPAKSSDLPAGAHAIISTDGSEAGPAQGDKRSRPCRPGPAPSCRVQGPRWTITVSSLSRRSTVSACVGCPSADGRGLQNGNSLSSRYLTRHFPGAELTRNRPPQTLGLLVGEAPHPERRAAD
jgi:hypothetical protein